MALDRTLDAHPVARLGRGVLNDGDQARQVREVHQDVEDRVARSLKQDRLLMLSHEAASQQGRVSGPCMG
jgi:hypothetical protein